MKRLLLSLLAFIAFSAHVYATVHSVSNMDSSAQYSTIQAACDASKSGDSIYVSPSIYNYDDFTINNKKLAVFGPGWGPFVGGTVNINNCSLSGSGASGSELHGLIISARIFINTEGIKNLIIYRNEIGGITFSGGSLDSCKIEGNWFYGLYLGGFRFNNGPTFTISNSSIRNNIFFETGGYAVNGNNTVFDHNLFYGHVYGEFGYFSNFIFKNNIFNQIDVSGVSFCTFNNNVTYNTANNTPWLVNNNTDAGGNIAATNPQMADQASVDAAINNPLLNFTIKSGSANNTGSDGKDMGLLFSSGKVTNWNYSRAAHLPYITELNITDQNIFSNGYIHFTVKAKSN